MIISAHISADIGHISLLLNLTVFNFLMPVILVSFGRHSNFKQDPSELVRCRLLVLICCVERIF